MLSSYSQQSSKSQQVRFLNLGFWNQKSFTNSQQTTITHVLNTYLLTAIMCYKGTGDTVKSKTKTDNKLHAIMLFYYLKTCLLWCSFSYSPWFRIKCLPQNVPHLWKDIYQGFKQLSQVVRLPQIFFIFFFLTLSLNLHFLIVSTYYFFLYYRNNI